MPISSLEDAYKAACDRRRGFHLDGHKSLADANLDGPYVSPIQLKSGSLTGPILIAKDWIDFDTAQRNLRRLKVDGYLPEIQFNKVLDLALLKLNLARDEVYITQVFHALPARRSSTISTEDLRASFSEVTQYEILGRKPVALGRYAERMCGEFGIACFPAPHPSARGMSFEERAKLIASAIVETPEYKNMNRKT